MCPRRYINLISNGLADKMVDGLGLNFFSPNIITKESIGISMWKLNKLHDMGMQSVGDKENEKVIPPMVAKLSVSIFNLSMYSIMEREPFRVI